MKTLRTYWPEMGTITRVLLAMQAISTGTNAIILIVNPSRTTAGLFAISIFVLFVLTAFAIGEIQARHHHQQHKENPNA